MLEVTDSKITVSGRKVGIPSVIIYGMMTLFSLGVVILWAYCIGSGVLTPADQRFELLVNMGLGIVMFMLICVFAMMVLYLVYNIREVLFTYVFDEQGIHRLSPFGEKHILWADLKDYGFSYFRKTLDYRFSDMYYPDRGHEYIFYVSDKKLENKKHGRKRLRGVSMWWHCAFKTAHVSGFFTRRKNTTAYRVILDFCASHTDIKPNMPELVTGYIYPDAGETEGQLI